MENGARSLQVHVTITVLRSVRQLRADRKSYGHAALHTHEMLGAMCAHSLLSAPYPTSSSSKMSKNWKHLYQEILELICAVLIERKTQRNTQAESHIQAEAERPYYYPRAAGKGYDQTQEALWINSVKNGSDSFVFNNCKDGGSATLSETLDHLFRW